MLLSLLDGCILVNFVFSSLQLQRQATANTNSTNADEEEEESSPNSEIIVPDYTVDSVANPLAGSTVVVDLLRRFPSDLIETSVDPEPLLSAGSDIEVAAAASAARVNTKTFLSLSGLSRRYNSNRCIYKHRVPWPRIAQPKKSLFAGLSTEQLCN